MQVLQNLIYAVLFVQKAGYALTVRPGAELVEKYCSAAGGDCEDEPAGSINSVRKSSHVEVQGDIGAFDRGSDFVRKFHFEDKIKQRQLRSKDIFNAKRSGDADLVDAKPLILAADAGHMEEVKLLLERGANKE